MKIQPQPFRICFTAGLWFTAQGIAFANPVAYDWSTASASAAGVLLDHKAVVGDNNDNWMNVGGLGDGRDDFVVDTGQPSLFSGNYYLSTGVGPPGSGGDDLYERPNDMAFGYAIPANAQSVSVSSLFRADSSLGIHRVGLRQHNESNPLLSLNALNLGYFGANNLWGVREWDGPAISAAATTGAGLLSAVPQVFRLTLTVDMTAVGAVKPIDLLIENLTGGGSELILDDVLYDLGPTADPTTWDALYLRIARAEADDITVSYVVPEPGTGPLVLLAACVVLMRRRRATA